MTLETGAQTERLEKLRALRQRLAELESAAGTETPLGPGGDPDTVRRGVAVLRGLMETLLLGFAVGDSKGNIVDANEAFANLLGYHRRELLDSRLNWQSLTAPEYADLDFAALEAIERTGLPQSYSKEYFRRDGSRVPVVIVVLHTTAERDEHSMFVLDDSERHNAESNLRRTEALYQQVLDAIPDLVVLRGPEARIAWANRAFLEFCGTTQAALLGSLNPPGRQNEAPEIVMRDYAVSVETGLTVDLPRQAFERADGETRIFHTVKSPVIRPGGSIVHTVSVSRDITQHARGEAALRRSEDNLRTAQALANVGSYHMPLPFGNDGYWSEQIFQMLGLPVSRVTMTAEEFIRYFVPSEHMSRVTAAVDGAILEGRPFDITYPIVRPDGSTFWLRSIGAPSRDAQGNVDGLVGTLMDVTEQREADAAREVLENRLRQAQKLEAVGALARGVAQDFNDILGDLSGHAEFALDEARDDPSVREDLQQVLHATGRASNLVARLLAFSQQPKRSEVQLRLERPIRDALALLRATLPADVEICEALHPDTPEILGDETRMIQVVMNLCTNALHAMEPGGGQLRVELEPFEVDDAFARLHPELQPGLHARLTVSDTGRGIEHHLLDRVLEPFFTTKLSGEGTGLGLSVVHSVVREHGGAMEIESTPGRGTTVRILLAANRTAA